MGAAKGGGKAPGGQNQALLGRAMQSGNELTSMAKDMYGMSRPVQQEASTQALQALRGGPLGMTAAISPLINQAVESNKLASAQTQARAGDEMARYGLTGTPFGQNVLQNMRQSGEMSLARIPTDMAYDNYWKTLGSLLPGALGQGSMGMQGMGAAAGLANQLGSGAQQAQLQQMLTEVGGFDPGK